MIEIDRKEAIDLIRQNAKERAKAKESPTTVAVTYKNRWFDVRGMSKEDIDTELAKLEKEDRDNRETDERKQEAVRKKK